MAASLILASTSVRADETWNLLLFGSLDAGASTFLTTGAKLGFGRLDRDGFLLLASFGTGSRAERATCAFAPAVTVSRERRTAMGSALAGHQWVSDWGVVALYAGPEGSVEMLTDGFGSAMLPPRYGLRLHGEIWARPTDDTLVQGTAILGTARMDAWLRLAWGYRLWGAYLGPEASLYADRLGYRKSALGLHATDFDLGRFSLRISAGLQTETGRRDPYPYLSISAWTPF
jgi:hypothetical protein